MRRLPFFPDGPPKVLIEPGTGEALDPDSSCTRCNAYKGARTPCIPPVVMPGRDPSAPTLLVIGDRVGQQEDLAGRAFASAAGQYLRREVEKLWHGPIAYTNAINCAVKAKVSPAMVRECRVYLRKLMEDLQPARVLVLGAQAARSVVDVALPPLSTRGAYARTSAGAPVFFLGNPADTARNSFVKKWFEEDLRHALVAEPATTPWNGAALLVENEADAVEACAALREGCDFDARTLSVDLEWYGYCGDNDFRVLTIGLSVGEDAYVWDEGVLGQLRPPHNHGFEADAIDAVLPLLELMEDPGIPKSAHAAKGDLRGFWFGFGCDVQGFQSCTRLFRKIEQADSYAYLEDLQALVGMAGWKGSGISASDEAVVALNTAAGEDLLLVEQAEERRLLGSKLTAKIEAGMSRSQERQRRSAAKERPSWVGDAEDFQNAVKRVISGRDPQAYMYGGVDAETRARYCAQDTVSQQALLLLLEPRVERDKGYSRVWRQVTRPFHRAVLKMECNGLRIDVEAAKKVQAYLGDKLLTAQYAVKDIAGEDFNPNASAQVAALLGKMGAPLGRPGKSGVPCVDKDVLKGLITAQDRNGRPQPYAEVAQRLTEVRRYTKLKGTYADGFLLRVTDDGYLHPNINIDGTESGRPSSEDPNTLNLPRPKTLEGKMIRDMILADLGWWLLEVDQSQVEFRKAGVMSGDRVMLEMFEAGVDFHTATAKLVAPLFGVKPEDVDDGHWLRDAAKTINFAILYGDTVEGTAHKLNVTVRRAQEIRDAILGKFKDLARWIKEMLSFARRSGYCVIPWQGQPGLRRPLWKIVSADKGERETAERGSWNCVDFETEALTMRGWVRGDQLVKEDVLLTKNAERGLLEWQGMTDLKVWPDYAGPLVEFKSRSFSAVSTPDHRWLVTNKATGKAECRVTAKLSPHGDHRIHRTGLYAPAPAAAYLSNDLVELFGWFLTDGSVSRSSAYLCQSERANPEKCARIAALLGRLGAIQRSHLDKRDAVRSWYLTREWREVLLSFCPARVLTPALLLKLTTQQAVLLSDVMLLGDGHAEVDGRRRLACGSEHKASMFQMLCVLAGVATTVTKRDMRKYAPTSKLLRNVPNGGDVWYVNLLRRDTAQVREHQTRRFTEARGIWCPMVPNTYFVARRRGTVFVTGNTPVQGAAALITNASCGGFQKWIDDTETRNHKLLLTVYDSILVGSRDGYVEEASEVLDGICCQWHPILRIDRKIGKSWGSMKAPPKAA